MADKFRVTFPIAINFSQGELPTAGKLTGVARQAKQGLSKLEYAIGDLWNQSGDHLLSDNPNATLNIPNLARYLGATALTNPRIPNLPEIEEYTYVFEAESGSSQRDKHTARLPFRPIGSYVWTGPTSRNSSPESTKAEVNGTGKWWVDTNTGEMFVWDYFEPGGFLRGDKLTYKPIVDGDLGENTFNVIPDPNTDSGYNYGGLKIEYVNTTTKDPEEGYYIYLPPRMPLIEERQWRNAPDNIDDNFSDPATDPRRFWMKDDPTIEVPTTDPEAEHYRYNLPTLLTNSSEWTSAVTIPVGFLYLMDPTTEKSIIEGLVFSAEPAGPPAKWKLLVKGANLTTWLSNSGETRYPDVNLENTDHTRDLYPNGGLRLIVVGSSLSSAFSSLIHQFLNHDHSSNNNPSGLVPSLTSRRISHHLLSGLFDNTLDPRHGSSAWNCDDHPQYLNRHGAKTHGVAYRDVNRGAMLGDLILANTAYNVDNYLNLISTSNKLFFGSHLGPYLRFNNNIKTILTTHGGLELNLPGGVNNIFRLVSSEGYLDLAIQNTGGALLSSSFFAFESDLGLAIYKSGTEYQDGQLYCNHICAGFHNDIQYGYSISNPSPETGYGPVRMHSIHLNDLMLFQRKFLFGIGSLKGLELEPMQKYHGNADVFSLNPSFDPSAIWVKMTSLTIVYSGWQLAIAPINLPFAKYGIVNARIQILSDQDILTSHNFIYATLGYDQYYKNSGNYIGSTIVGSINLPEATGVRGPGADILAANTDYSVLLYPVYTTLVPIYVNNYRQDTTGPYSQGLYRNVPWIRIMLKQTSGTTNPTRPLNVYIKGIEVQYRVQEH